MIAKRHLNATTSPMGACDNLGHHFNDLINLSLGDPDLTTPQNIIKAAFEDAKNGHTHYTEFLGDPELREAISKDQKVAYDEIMITTSGCHAMWLVLETILDEGDEVIIPAPYFTPYPEQVKLARGIPVFHQTYEIDNFIIDIKRIETQITPKTKVIIINTPNNPTGACLPKKVLVDLAALSRKHKLILIADDIYTAYHYAFEFTPMREVYENTITISSFSKDYCMTGWRVGYVIAPENVIHTMQRINENNVFTAPSISQRAALHAVQHKQVIQKELMTCFKERLMYAYERILKIPYLDVLKPEGGIYLFVNISKSGLKSKAFSDYILENAHLLVLPGITFGDYDDYIRIAVTVNLEALKTAFDRLDQLVFKEALCLK